MKHKNKLTNDLVPYIRKEHFDDVASEFLRKYYPEALLSPIQVPIDKIAQEKMGLTVEYVNITEDLGIYGQIFFTDGMVEVYVRDTDEYIRRNVKRGTVFIDDEVFFQRTLGCVRNTLAHECLHWFKHRAYHTVQSLIGNDMAVACKCPTDGKLETFKHVWTQEDWMEWQANGIAPKILMPREMFRVQAETNAYLKLIKGGANAMHQFYFEMAVEEIAKFFNVSKQSASIRLNELGYSSGL